MPTKLNSISRLLSQVLENTPHLQGTMFSTLEELVKGHPAKKPMTVKQWSEYLKPGQILKKVDKETGKQAQFNLAGAELDQSGFNKLLAEQPDTPLTQDELLQQLQPYQLKQDYARRSESGTPFSRKSATGEPSAHYADMPYFDSVISGKSWDAGGVAGNLQVNDVENLLRDIAKGQGDVDPRFLNYLDRQHDMTREYHEEMLRDGGIDEIDPDDMEAIKKAVDTDIGTTTKDFAEGILQGNMPFDVERVYDEYLTELKDLGSIKNREALPEYLLKDARQMDAYPMVEGKHFDDRTMSHSRVNQMPLLSDLDHILSEIQSDVEPYTRDIYKEIERLGNRSEISSIKKEHMANADVLDTTPFLKEYPRLQMNRALAEAVAADQTPGYLIYNNANDFTSAAPEQLYKSVIPSQFKRVSRSYGLPLTNTAEELTKRSVRPDGSSTDYTTASAQKHFSGAVPIKENLDYLRRMGVPFLSASPLMLLMNQGREE